MKKWFVPFALLTALTACSASNESRQVANDSYQKHGDTPNFAPLNTGGVTIFGQDNTYQLPSSDQISKGPAVDIRPPSIPMSIIGNSVAQFDGERASIVYPAEKSGVYNLTQIGRLLGEENISFRTQGKQIETDWAASGRSDEVGDLQIRYLIEEINTAKANALVVSVLQAKRNDIVFTPKSTDKQRYTSDRLNSLIGKLNQSYRTQLQQVATLPQGTLVETALVTDANGHTALAMSSDFNLSWQKLADALPAIGFEIEEENPGRGYRGLEYKAADPQVWLRLGLSAPALEEGEYHMQLSTYGGKYSSVVITDEDKEALSGEQAQAVYQALQLLISK
ncbi:Beta-barrel assembly machine subunit BamC [Mesocricetibacter intestinalis]|uniref:Outer membrane protein assembly factor BamC n=1 Tax=Mesocricetibacter intestinalis TaxID=1521930 RepID=A0A4R6VC01_9PAST|nr:outer membrane protein assembly factor BamC [Mesocricetibacter intestinalis]TDQ57609.1 Beta-barrel assembly machine subunit BamC [Mesocricetibacter intestinalis]